MWHLIFLVISFGMMMVMVTTNEDECNEMVCGSVISKCQLTQSCGCKLNDCHCCKDCFNCLGELYTECCGCLDMCPQQKDLEITLTPRSEIGDVEGIPELFDTLTAEDDDQWSTIHMPMRAGFKQRYEGINSDFSNQPIESMNCTVIYVNTCIRSLKCKQQCESMGANSYRWFHNGCCECVGAYCLNYGINESRCTSCPEEQDQNTDDADRMTDAEQDLEHNFGFEDDANNDMWDYGENDDMF